MDYDGINSIWKLSRAVVSAWVATVVARCPPAEQPFTITISSGFMSPFGCILAHCFYSIGGILVWQFPVPAGCVFYYGVGYAHPVEVWHPIQIPSYGQWRGGNILLRVGLLPHGLVAAQVGGRNTCHLGDVEL